MGRNFAQGSWKKKVISAAEESKLTVNGLKEFAEVCVAGIIPAWIDTRNGRSPHDAGKYSGRGGKDGKVSAWYFRHVCCVDLLKPRPDTGHCAKLRAEGQSEGFAGRHDPQTKRRGTVGLPVPKTQKGFTEEKPLAGLSVNSPELVVGACFALIRQSAQGSV